MNNVEPFSAPCCISASDQIVAHVECRLELVYVEVIEGENESTVSLDTAGARRLRDWLTVAIGDGSAPVAQAKDERPTMPLDPTVWDIEEGVAIEDKAEGWHLLAVSPPTPNSGGYWAGLWARRRKNT